MKPYLEKTKKHFDSPLTDYYRSYARLTPKFDDMHECLVNAIPFPRGAKLKVLDFGIGTGYAALLIVEKFPNSRITGVDFSPKMLKLARRRLELHKSRFKLVESEITEFVFEEMYDIIFSVHTIEHLKNDDKKKLFKKIHEHLANGGCFINADHISFASPVLQEKTRKADLAFVAANLVGAEREHWLRHMNKEEFPATLEDQFAWLKEAGFSEDNMDTIWMYNNIAIYIAFKL